MSRALTCDLEFMCRVDPAASRDLVCRAVACRAQIQLLVPTAEEDVVLVGELIHESGPSLGVRIDGPPGATSRATGASIISVSFELSGTHYFFETSCIRDAESGGEIIHLRRPASMSILDRRRSSRWSPRKPAEVIISPVGGTGTSLRHAAMLNVGSQGIACRISKVGGQDLNLGDVLLASFRAGLESKPFEFHSRITNITEGGTSATVILGMEFIQDAEYKSDLARLQKALRAG